MTLSNWLLLQVKPRQEMRALENLERQQGMCYCPLIQVEKLSRGKRIHAEEALFPGYIFINFDPQKSNLTYTAIRSSRGVSKIVRFGDEPAKVPESLILQIKDCEKVNLPPLNAPNLPQKGDAVIIVEGPFKGLQAVYSQTDGQQRSIVLISLLHQQAPTSLANTQIQKIA
jgi:transcriptional antiterminator RfaH